MLPKQHYGGLHPQASVFVTINGDSRVNNLDVIILFRYLSNWDVEIH
jgi:hypothetical protein